LKHIANGTIISGLSQDTTQKIWEMIEILNLYEEEEAYKEIQLHGTIYYFHHQYIKMNIQDRSIPFSSNIPSLQYHIIVNEKGEGDLKIGRGPHNDLILLQSGVSYDHGKIFFDKAENQWCIQDGTENGPSTNGIWKCLTRSRDKMLKKESAPIEINMQDQFKMGDTIVQVDWNEYDAVSTMLKHMTTLKELARIDVAAIRSARRISEGY
jgi:hypothetical protein